MQCAVKNESIPKLGQHALSHVIHSAMRQSRAPFFYSLCPPITRRVPNNPNPRKLSARTNYFHFCFASNVVAWYVHLRKIAVNQMSAKANQDFTLANTFLYIFNFCAIFSVSFSLLLLLLLLLGLACHTLRIACLLVVRVHRDGHHCRPSIFSTTFTPFLSNIHFICARASFQCRVRHGFNLTHHDLQSNYLN